MIVVHHVLMEAAACLLTEDALTECVISTNTKGSNMNRNKFILTGIFVLLFSINACAQNVPEMKVSELKQAMKSDSTLVILDVRTKEELAGELGKIDGVINIPVQELEKRINELGKYKKNNIAVICKSGRRSAVATKLLNKNGFKAKSVAGGMIEYREQEAKPKK